MIKQFLSAIALSRAFMQVFAQDMPGSGSGIPPTDSCPEYCFVNATGPMINQTPFQGPVVYKNINYNAMIVPSQSFQLVDSTGRQDNYQYKGWILSNNLFVGQVFSSNIANIMVGFECNTLGQLFQSYSDACMDTIMYLNPQFCTISFQTSMTCPSQTPSPPRDTMTPSMSSVPTRQSEPSMSSQPTRQAEPSMSSVPTKQSEPSMSSQPTRQAEPSMSSQPTRQAEPSMTSQPTRQSEPSMSSQPTRQSEPSMSSVPTRQAEPSMSSQPTKREEPSMSELPSDFPNPSDFPMPSEHPSHNETCDDLQLCIKRDVIAPNLTLSEPIVTELLTDINTSQYIITISSNLVVRSNITRTYEFSGWVIVDGMFVGQRFTNSTGAHIFIQFACGQRNFIGLIKVDDPCVPRLVLMHPTFCINLQTDEQCAVPGSGELIPTFTARPTQFPTRRPDTPSDKPTPRPTYSALPTRRPTLSTMPTRMFRSPPPVERAKTLRSQLRIETRNESLFQNPKNVEAVVKTVVCTLNVKPETVQVTGIQHFVDNVLVGTIPVPQINSSRNYTRECVEDSQPAGPSYVPLPSQPPLIEPVAMRRLQSGLDTYVVQYQVQDPPASVTSLDPATVATMIETTPTLVNSLDIPAGSYVAITAEQPTYAAAEPVVVSQNNSHVTNILMGVLIPVGVAIVGSVIAMTLRKRNMPITSDTPAVVMQFAPVVPNRVIPQNEIHPIKLASDNVNFTQSNPRIKVVRSASKHSVQPVQVRK